TRCSLLSFSFLSTTTGSQSPHGARAVLPRTTQTVDSGQRRLPAPRQEREGGDTQQTGSDVHGALLAKSRGTGPDGGPRDEAAMRKLTPGANFGTRGAKKLAPGDRNAQQLQCPVSHGRPIHASPGPP